MVLDGSVNSSENKKQLYLELQCGLTWKERKDAFGPHTSPQGFWDL